MADSYDHATKYTDNGSTFHSMPPMPCSVADHCMTVLNNGNMFVAGADKRCFLYDSEKKKWRKCPDMATRRDRACCAVIKKGDGTEEVVVSGGNIEEFFMIGGTKVHYFTAFDTVEIFSLEESRWRSGKYCTVCSKNKTEMT